MNLLAGAVAFIDDEIGAAASTASALLADIRATGRPVAAAASLPTDRDAWFEHWQSLAFVVLDWDLSPGSSGAIGGSTLSAYEREKLYDFVDALLERVFCPVFIISAENTDGIKTQLLQHQSFVTASESLDPRLAVFSKAILMADIVAHLTQWVEATPALQALITWAREQDRAKNRLFIDFNELAPDWPAYVWRAATADGVDAGYELASVISTNLLNRVDPVTFDASALSAYNGDLPHESMRKVAAGRTMLSADRLPEKMIFPGDLFAFPDDSDADVWMNVSPVCQTVGRDSNPIMLHLIHGTREDLPSSQTAFSKLHNRSKGPTGTVIHALFDGNPYYFSFGRARISSWEDAKPHRKGRLLPPFVTRVQQMHAAYLQSEGVPSVTSELYGIPARERQGDAQSL